MEHQRDVIVLDVGFVTTIPVFVIASLGIWVTDANTKLFWLKVVDHILARKDVPSGSCVRHQNIFTRKFI